MPDRLDLRLESRRATRALASAIAPHLSIGDVIWLEGPLGAGKTFFVRGLMRALGVPSSIPITSPTFGLVHAYEARIPVRHLDLYRVSDASELRELGIDEAIDEALVVIEWGARFRDSIGANGLAIALEIADPGRIARLTAHGERGRTLLAALARDPTVARRTLA